MKGARRAREVGDGSVIVLCGNGRTLFSDVSTVHNTVLALNNVKYTVISIQE
jgi:hypothetical protein